MDLTTLVIAVVVVLLVVVLLGSRRRGSGGAYDDQDYRSRVGEAEAPGTMGHPSGAEGRIITAGEVEPSPPGQVAPVVRPEPVRQQRDEPDHPPTGS